MGPQLRDAAMKDVQNMQRMEEFAGHMGLKLIGRLVALKDVQI